MVNDRVDVLGVRVRLVESVMSHVIAACKVAVAVPSFKARVVVPLALNVPPAHVDVWLLKSSVPEVSVTVPFAKDAALLNNHSPPAPLKITLPRFFPPKVIKLPVVVDTNLRNDVAEGLYVIPETRVKCPCVPSPMLRYFVAACVSVPVYPVASKLRHREGEPDVPSIVSVPLPAVNTTSSAAVGTIPSAHAVVSDQFLEAPPLTNVRVAIRQPQSCTSTVQDPQTFQQPRPSQHRLRP